MWLILSATGDTWVEYIVSLKALRIKFDVTPITTGSFYMQSKRGLDPIEQSNMKWYKHALLLEYCIITSQ